MCIFYLSNKINLRDSDRVHLSIFSGSFLDSNDYVDNNLYGLGGHWIRHSIPRISDLPLYEAESRCACANFQTALSRSGIKGSNLLTQQWHTLCRATIGGLLSHRSSPGIRERKTARHVSRRAYRIEGIPWLPSGDSFDRKETFRST